MEGFHNRSSFSFSCKKIYVLKNGLIIVIKVDKIHIKEKSVFCGFCISTLHTAIPHIFTTKMLQWLYIWSSNVMLEKISFSKACIYWNFKGLEEDTFISAYEKCLFYPFLLLNLWLANKDFSASTIIRGFSHVKPSTR